MSAFEELGALSRRSFPVVTLTVVSLALSVSFLPDLGKLLEYDRQAVAGGQVWRLFTGQLAHWTPRMTVADLGVLLGLGIWLERRSRRIFVGSLVSGAVLVAGGIHLVSRELVLYRGSSGMVSAAFTAVALVLVCDRHLGLAVRGLGLLAMLLVGSKIVWEISLGAPLAAGTLPPDVRVTPVVHLIGAVAGLGTAAFFLVRERSSPLGERAEPPARNETGGSNRDR